jgi:hypothetical protein
MLPNFKEIKRMIVDPFAVQPIMFILHFILVIQ